MSEMQAIESLDPTLRGLCESTLRAAQVPGASIAIVAEDSAYHLSYGVKSIASGEPVTAQSGFDIASCTKAFVSATMASLVADGLVSWDDPITRYVPEFALCDPVVTRQATLRDLSANRLGLPRGGLMEFGLDPRFTGEHVFARLRHTQPLHALRTRFGYFNAGHSANAVAIGRITGAGFLATLRGRLLEPLGMHGSSGGEAARHGLKDQAAWHGLVDGRMQTYDALYLTSHFGAGGMVVSGADAVPWLRLHLNGGVVNGRQVIERGALRETHTPQIVAHPGQDIASLFYPGAHMAAYALGWAVCDVDGHPVLCHSGSSLGVSSMTLLLPRSRLGIAVYCNATGGHAPPLAYAIAAQLLGLAPRDWKAALTLPAAPGPVADADVAMLPADAYAGYYAHPADGPLLVQTLPGGAGLAVEVLHGYRLGFTATPTTGHRFAVHFGHPEWRAMFANDVPELIFKVTDGQVVSARLSAGPMSREFCREGAGNA